jgi:hypothetical protein
MLMQVVLTLLCKLIVLFNQHDPSGQVRMRPSLTGLFNSNVLVIKGAAKAASSAVHTAISELIAKYHAKGCVI